MNVMVFVFVFVWLLFFFSLCFVMSTGAVMCGASVHVTWVWDCRSGSSLRFDLYSFSHLVFFFLCFSTSNMIILRELEMTGKQLFLFLFIKKKTLKNLNKNKSGVVLLY